MDLFSRKAKAKLKKVEKQRDDLTMTSFQLQAKNGELSRANDALIKTLRDQDQLIFLMSQGTSWEQQRPHFNKLQEGQERRMRLESDRIRDVLIPEVRKAYTKDNRIRSDFEVHGTKTGRLPRLENK